MMDFVSSGCHSHTRSVGIHRDFHVKLSEIFSKQQ